MLQTRALTLLLAAVGASAQRGRWGGGGPPWRNNGNSGGGQVTQPPAAPATPVRIPGPGETQTMWGQCGGREWSGTNTCPREAACFNDGNEWYSQCIPIEDLDESGNPVLDDPFVQTQVLTTYFDIPGPTPTVVTTWITVLSPLPTAEPGYVTTITAVPDSPIPRRRLG